VKSPECIRSATCTFVQACLQGLAAHQAEKEGKVVRSGVELAVEEGRLIRTLEDDVPLQRAGRVGNFFGDQRIAPCRIDETQNKVFCVARVIGEVHSGHQAS
jgi:hypothetical protein